MQLEIKGLYNLMSARPNELQMLAVGESPCPIASGKGSCNDMGAETINGRKAEKWEIRQSARLGGDLNEQIILSRIWVDSKLHVWVKFESTVGDTFIVSNELQDIQECPQPASLFVIPAGLRKSEF